MQWWLAGEGGITVSERLHRDEEGDADSFQGFWCQCSTDRPMRLHDGGRPFPRSHNTTNREGERPWRNAQR